MTSTCAFERAWERVEEVACEDLDAVGPCAGDGALVDLRRDDAGIGAARRAARRRSHRCRCRGRWRCRRFREALRGAQRQMLALPARDVDAGVDPDRDATERDAAGDPRERLAGEAPLDATPRAAPRRRPRRPAARRPPRRRRRSRRPPTARRAPRDPGCHVDSIRSELRRGRCRRARLDSSGRPVAGAGSTAGAGRLGSQRCSSGGPFSGNGMSMRSKSRGTSVRGKIARASSRISPPK